MKRISTILLSAVLLSGMMIPTASAADVCPENQTAPDTVFQSGFDTVFDFNEDNAQLLEDTAAHDWMDWTVSKNPAKEMRTCRLCGATDTRYRQAGTEFQPAPPSPAFTDVNAKDYFYDPVVWAVRNEITQGTSETTFSPNKACTRAEAVTLMWRAFGDGSSTGAANPFRDVPDDAYYHDAILWACSKNITKGTSDSTFDPNARCTRGQIVTFLWRLMGDEEANTTWELMDVEESEFYYMPVKWVLRNNIAKGTTDLTFSPKSFCTRAEMTTFLYRTMFMSDVNKICQQEFIDMVAAEVAKFAPSYGIKSYSGVIAQCILETGWGKSQLAIRYHNFFGIKCGPSWGGKRATIVKYKPNAEGVLVRRSSEFRAYDSVDAGFEGYFKFVQSSRYRNVRGITDPYKYLKTILADGYTESYDYADRCYVYVTDYDLTRYDPK